MWVIKMLKINLEYRKGILFVRLKGNLNKNTASKFMEYTLPIIEDYGIKYMVYNLEGLSSIDSVGENALLSGGKSVKENDGRVLLINNKVNTCLRFDKITDELVALDLLKI